MPGRSVRIGRIVGISVGVSPWWLVIVALVARGVLLPRSRPRHQPRGSYALGLASALVLFASILAHEFGRAIAARRHGIEIEEINLWPAHDPPAE